MNKSIDLKKILKDCPRGTKFYTTVWGEVSFRNILKDSIYAFSIDTCSGNECITKEGCYIHADDAECIIFPSKTQRDWSKFTAPWYKKEKFDLKTLQPFDKVLVRDRDYHYWRCNLFSHIETENPMFPYTTHGGRFSYCIPYNDDTACLVGTKDEPSEFYRYWED